jgi:hypothetical protein
LIVHSDIQNRSVGARPTMTDSADGKEKRLAAICAYWAWSVQQDTCRETNADNDCINLPADWAPRVCSSRRQ